MKKLALNFCFIMLASSLFAQQDFNMYNLQGIPQSNYSNPSNRIDGKFYIGLPAMSSIYLNYSNSGFKYSDAIKPQGDSLLLDFNQLLNRLEDENYLALSTKIDLLSFGFAISPKTQLNFNITEVLNFRFDYPKDFMKLIYEGNAGFGSDKADMEGIGIGLDHYREYGIGVSHQVNEKLRLGLRAKYLYGMENIYSEKTDISLFTDPNTFELKAKADINIRTAGIENVDDDESEDTYATGRDNHGFGIDLGANYQLNDKWSFNASLLDLGFIRWNSYTKSYKNNGGEYSYSGVEVDAFGEEDENGETSFDRVLDSLEDAFGLKESEGAYTSPLISRLYLGANYHISEKDFAGVLIQNEFFNKRIKPSFTLSYNRKLTKWITAATSVTAIHRSFNNVGLGLVFDPGPVQFYLVSDNVLGMFKPQDAQYLQVRFGINLIFGRNKSKKMYPDYISRKQKKGLVPEKDSLDTEAMPAESLSNDSLKTEQAQSASDSLGGEFIQALDSNAVDSSLIPDSIPADSLRSPQDSLINNNREGSNLMKETDSLDNSGSAIKGGIEKSPVEAQSEEAESDTGELNTESDARMESTEPETGKEITEPEGDDASKPE